MINEKAVLLLEKVIKEKYKNIELDNKYFDEEEFYYEFKINEKISENDFELLEKEIRKLDDSCFVKLLRISGVYYNGDSNNEMIDRISGKAFDNLEKLEEYLKFIEDAKERDHRKIGKDLDLFCFSDYVGPGLPLFTPRGTIIIDELKREIEGVCRRTASVRVE
jgi:threonyl-tRNA synthetase